MGIETSCDETSVAIVSADRQILAHALVSQIEEHADFGGVVPEIAARSHVDILPLLAERALTEAGLAARELDAVAATTGPGLMGGLMVGMVFAKSFALAADKPFIAVNHLEGHALTARLTGEADFPFLLLLVSGGHCQLLDVANVGKYTRLGSTIDDAVGEAFDKTAKLLGLDYPGGPAVEKAALKGRADRFDLPRPLLGKPGLDFSFSGLKTAVRRVAEDCVAKRGALYDDDVADICAGFQTAVADCLTDRTEQALQAFIDRHKPEKPMLVVAGGVAANRYLIGRLKALADRYGATLESPPMALCTDNGAMIAWAGLERFTIDPDIDDQLAPAWPRWPLDETAAAVYGGGKKGAKA